MKSDKTIVTDPGSVRVVFVFYPVLKVKTTKAILEISRRAFACHRSSISVDSCIFMTHLYSLFTLRKLHNGERGFLGVTRLSTLTCDYSGSPTLSETALKSAKNGPERGGDPHLAQSLSVTRGSTAR